MKDQSPELLEDLVGFFKKKKVDYPAVLFLNALRPFKRTISFAMPVFFPLLSIVFGLERVQKIGKMFEDENFLEQLKTSLEKGLK